MSYFKKLYENGNLPHRAKLVYLYLHDRMDKERKAWPGIKTIAQDLSISRSTAGKNCETDTDRLRRWFCTVLHQAVPNRSAAPGKACVYLSSRPYGQGKKGVAGTEYHCKGSVSLPKHCKTGGQRLGKIRSDTKRGALP